ncbi:hypothetical protein MKS88_002161 [Plasmodium brasilianum]|uniref:Uncharacterized protein n=1 Tax=Plasmodium brasilianum TaxID=5824 RepID=A0ACB9YEG2_PLABR|nr:hypothetical protein MKS88_002161 [Plasmodium brasilianum]
MEQKIKTLLFKKISAIIILSWICHIYIYTRTHNESLVKCYNSPRILYTRKYRLLAKYNQDRNSTIVYLKEDMPNDKRDTSNNEKCVIGKKKQSNGSLPRNARCHKKNMKNKSYIFETGKYSYIEKKIFKELDYLNFLKNKRTISDKLYKKIILKKFSLRLSFPVILLLLFSIALLVELFVGYGVTNLLFGVLSRYLDKSGLESLQNTLLATPFGKMFYTVVEISNEKKSGLIRNFLGFIVYFSVFFILGISMILGIAYYHKKVKKYDKIIFKRN